MKAKFHDTSDRPDYLVQRLALIGGVVAIVGDNLIRWTGNLFLFTLTHVFIEDFRYSLPAFFLPSLTWVLLDFLAGFLAVHILAPFAIRRAGERTQSQRRSIATRYGALCGLMACLLLAFLHLSIFFVVPTILRDGWSKLEWGVHMYATYLKVAIVMAGLPAALIGAVAGRLAVRFVPPHLPEHRPLA